MFNPNNQEDLVYKVIEMAEDIKQGRADSETGCTNLMSFVKEFLENNNLSCPEEQHNTGPSQLLMIQNEPINSQSSTQNELFMAYLKLLLSRDMELEGVILLVP